MLLCGADITKGDIVRLSLACPSGWIPSRYPVCKIESTNARRGVIVVKYLNIKGINVQIGGILGCNIISKSNTNKVNIKGTSFTRGDTVNIDGISYIMELIDTNSKGEICIRVENKEKEDVELFPIEDLPKHSISVLHGDSLSLSELSFAIFGRQPIIKNNELVGINFGYSMKYEYKSLEEGLDFVNILNLCQSNRLTLKTKNNLVKRVIKKFGQNEEFLRLSNFLVHPTNIEIFERKIENHGSVIPGVYTCIGLANYKESKKLKEIQRPGFQLDIPYSDYIMCGNYLACYDWNVGWLYFLINSSEKEIIDNMVRCLKTGLLAIIPKPFGRNGLGVIFVDKLCYKTEIVPSMLNK